MSHFIRIPVEEEDHDNNAATGPAISEHLYNNREDVNEIHHEYSKLYYPQKSKLCSCHGVM
jgi:hypothetical protein